MTGTEDGGSALPMREDKPVRAKLSNGPKWEATARERIRAALRRFGTALADLAARDANEGDTRLFVTDFLCDALGFDKYAELTTEYQVKGEFADYGIRIDKEIVAFIEVKRINTKLGPKHLRQVQSYAVNEGVEWLLLTNGAQWQAYHLTGGLPVVTDLALEVDLLNEQAPQAKANLLFHLSREALKKGKLAELWQAKRATSPKSLATILCTPAVVDAVRKELRRSTGQQVPADEIQRLIRETVLRNECLC